MDHQKLFAIMNGKDRSAKAHLMRAGLSCAEPFYRLATGVRNKLFDWGIRKATKLPRPVISVGNITTGGTGKTPMVITLVRKLLAMGEKPAVLLRGYGSTWTSDGSVDDNGNPMDGGGGALTIYESDETKVYRSELPNTVAVEPHASRLEGARQVLRESQETSVFLLDDGFQHRKVKRELDVVLVDATQPFGFNRVLPRGLLRETMRNLQRADVVIITRCDQVVDDAIQTLNARIKTLTGQSPIAHARESWSSLRDKDNATYDLNRIAGQRVLGVCGIGNPKGFIHRLNQYSQVVETVTFKDHHIYDTNELERFHERAVKASCDAIVTTEKDWVKWHEAWQWLNASIPVYRPILDIQFIDGEDTLDELIRERVLNKSVP